MALNMFECFKTLYYAEKAEKQALSRTNGCPSVDETVEQLVSCSHLFHESAIENNDTVGSDKED